MNISKYLVINQRITLHANTGEKDFIYECPIKKIKDDLIAVVFPDKFKDSPVCGLETKIILKWAKNSQCYSLSTKIVQNKSFPLVALAVEGEVVELEAVSSEIQGEIPGQQNQQENFSAVSNSEKASDFSSSLDHLRSLVNEIPQLYTLGPEEVNILLHYISHKSAKKGYPLFKEGEPGNSVYYIGTGVIDIIKESLDGNPIKLARFYKDTMLGEMALVDPAPRSATAMVMVDAELIILTKEKFESLLKEYPAVGIKIFKQIARTLSQRIRFANGKLADTLDQTDSQIPFDDIE